MKNLPKVIEALIEAQNHFNGLAYADCFTETAVVYDEGKTHNGKKEIQNWIEKAHTEYNVVMKPLEYSENEQTLKAAISGTFPGSPLVLTYEFEFHDQMIQGLKIG